MTKKEIFYKHNMNLEEMKCSNCNKRVKEYIWIHVPNTYDDVFTLCKECFIGE